MFSSEKGKKEKYQKINTIDSYSLQYVYLTDPLSNIVKVMMDSGSSLSPIDTNYAKFIKLEPLICSPLAAKLADGRTLKIKKFGYMDLITKPPSILN